jgi:hypothetical protein
MPYRSDLQANIKTFSYDFEARVGTLQTAPYQSADMGECINLFESIDPHVERIDAVAGNEPDIRYTRSAGGWKVRRIRKKSG